MIDASAHIERLRVHPFPPKISWDSRADFSDKPRKGLITHLNSPWIKVKDPIPVFGEISPVIAHEYRDGGMAINHITTKKGIIIYNEQLNLYGRGINIPWALRDLRRQLILVADVINIPNTELTDFGLDQATRLRPYIELLVTNPEALLRQYS